MEPLCGGARLEIIADLWDWKKEAADLHCGKNVAKIATKPGEYYVDDYR
jgi:hypothetical protein